MSSNRYYQLDVFTHRPGGGNPLGVVVGADDWSDAAMQAFARVDRYRRDHLPAASESSRGELSAAHLHADPGDRLRGSSVDRQRSCRPAFGIRRSRRRRPDPGVPGRPPADPGRRRCGRAATLHPGTEGFGAEDRRRQEEPARHDTEQGRARQTAAGLRRGRTPLVAGRVRRGIGLARLATRSRGDQEDCARQRQPRALHICTQRRTDVP